MANITLHPDFAKLKAEVDKLRAELSMLVLERDSLLHQECKNIETAYMLSVGALEYKAYEIECALLRLKRQAELIQAKKNRQEKIVLPRIEAALDAEFAEYQARLNEQLDKMNVALQRGQGELLTEEEVRELKKLYLAVVKALHPDLHPDADEAKILLFHNAVEAYEHGDLSNLRIIAAMVSEPALPAGNAGRLALLMKEQERLTRLLKDVRDRITEIMLTYPYTMKSLVQSPALIEARKAELEKHIRELNEALAAYKARIEELLEGPWAK